MARRDRCVLCAHTEGVAVASRWRPFLRLLLACKYSQSNSFRKVASWLDQAEELGEMKEERLNCQRRRRDLEITSLRAKRRRRLHGGRVQTGW